MLLLFLIRVAECSSIWNDLCIWLTVRALLEHLSVCVYAAFACGLAGRMWGLIV